MPLAVSSHRKMMTGLAVSVPLLVVPLLGRLYSGSIAIGR